MYYLATLKIKTLSLVKLISSYSQGSFLLETPGRIHSSSRMLSWHCWHPHLGPHHSSFISAVTLSSWSISPVGTIRIILFPSNISDHFPISSSISSSEISFGIWDDIVIGFGDYDVDIIRRKNSICLYPSKFFCGPLKQKKH